MQKQTKPPDITTKHKMIRISFIMSVTSFLLLFPVATIPKITDMDSLKENHPKIHNTINKITEKAHENVAEVRKDEQK